MAYLDEHSFRSKLHRWRFNLTDGTTREEHLDERIMEFGMINAALRRPALPLRLFHPQRAGLVPVQRLRQERPRDTASSWTYDLAPGRYASEAPFAPRIGGTAEDDGYLVSFVTDENAGRSECVILDAARIQDGPVCRIALPHKLCSGTHACWADRGQIGRPLP